MVTQFVPGKLYGKKDHMTSQPQLTLTIAVTRQARERTVSAVLGLFIVIRGGHFELLQWNLIGNNWSEVS